MHSYTRVFFNDFEVNTVDKIHTAIHGEVDGAPRADGVGPRVRVQTVDVRLLKGVQCGGGGTVFWHDYPRG